MDTAKTKFKDIAYGGWPIASLTNLFNPPTLTAVCLFNALLIPSRNYREAAPSENNMAENHA